MRFSLVIFLLLSLFLTVTRSDRLTHDADEASRGHNAGGTILVSTIDGYLTALDMHTGAIKWRYKEGPVLDSSKYLQADFSYIPNPRNGHLYVISEQQLKRLPFTIPELVTVSPCKSSDGILYSGEKKDVWIAINPDTGVHQETIPPQTTNSCPVGHPETVFIGRTDYRVFMSDTKGQSRRWNATFVDYSSHLLPMDQEYPLRHFHSSADGRIVTFDTTTQEVRWKLDFRSVIVNLYLLKHDGMHRLPSTSVGKGTFDVLEQNPQLLHFSQWANGPLDDERTMSSDPRLLQTLFIGDSEHGLYALNSFVDQKLDTFSLKTLGPLLIEGPGVDPSENAAIPIPPLPAGADLQGSVYRTTTGDFLLLGHHDIPPVLLKADGRQGGGLLEHKTDPKKAEGGADDDWGWERIFVQVWRKSPHVVLGAFTFILGLIIAVVFFYAKHNAVLGIMASQSGESLSVSRREVLGRGCAGTNVYRGTFKGREVAVKRVVKDQVTLIDREIDLLRISDAHPNVIRYFCDAKEDKNFVYIALELCECTLKDYVYSTTIQERYAIGVRDILKQATDGIAYLHSTGIVHRDLKPQNILLNPTGDKRRVRVLISDFGLCKMIKPGHASVSKVSGLAGTDGWIAPEMMQPDLASVTYAVDVFALGCVFYFTLTEGRHPFGEPLQRQGNIQKGRYDMTFLIGDHVAYNLIERMIDLQHHRRPPINAVAAHPDRMEKLEETDNLVGHLEANNLAVLGTYDWHRQLSKELQEDLRKFRKYRGDSVRDLMRAMRNKKHHYQELSEELRRSLGDVPDGYVTYFTDRFPKLLIHVFQVMALCANEPNFQTYYPDDTRSFCGRVLKEATEDPFKTVNNLQRSPKRPLPQRLMAGRIPTFDPTIPPPPPGFEGVQPKEQPKEQPMEQPKEKRKRTRTRKNRFSAFELDEAGDADREQAEDE
ncbi:Serine/threonine-protein kinase/endoribonuclease ire-1 [Aphelenchoides fujianensis]|nr:Serine/threonine-protein kinase/endoribonuclease ire-1 [Aphelenchoides fujianensis]